MGLSSRFKGEAEGLGGLVMRFVWRGVLAAVVLLAAASVGAFWYFIGTPFGFNAMLNEQSLEQVPDHPQVLTFLGVIDGTVLDFHSGKLDEYSLAERAREYDRARRDET